MALWVFGSIVYLTLFLCQKVEVMGMISVLGLAANLTPVLLLTVSWTGHHCWLRSILANRIEIRTAWRSGYGRVPQCRC
jgi:hypothetical protein